MFRRNATFLVIAALTLASGTAVLLLRGRDAALHALAATWDLVVTVLPSILGGLLLSAALRQLVPPGVLARWMGAESGLRGLLVATAAGMAMPGGPVAAFPVVLVLAQAGADRGALIAFVLAWSLNGFQRIVVWELPILGFDFSLLRFLCGLPLPVLAGLFARWLPIRWTPAEAPGLQERPMQERPMQDRAPRVLASSPSGWWRSARWRCASGAARVSRAAPWPMPAAGWGACCR